jgi:hypothetical protein
MKRAILAAATFAALALPAAAAPDLRPSFNAANGTVKIKNAGTAAGASVVTINCQRTVPPVVGGGGGCPDIPPAFVAAYSNPAFPNVLAINVGPLGPGKSFTHTVAFFGGLVFPPGTYVFTTTADAGGTVAESNEGNNVVVRNKVVP